ncbi:hypothetical protein QJS10_CPB17g01170 [Acorus calamus]|uniref:Heparan-alpha-glucosaminide N-acetyltransferase catalytic domain-containing protein n=1 Tax=Acorus calamus TaxID=4465 RepID=A0AAV9CST0_ACOCL|nr:hypothetical protein QJS10_CPB17g01170 [Acorus calamus]
MGPNPVRTEPGQYRTAPRANRTAQLINRTAQLIVGIQHQRSGLVDFRTIDVPRQLNGPVPSDLWDLQNERLLLFGTDTQIWTPSSSREKKNSFHSYDPPEKTRYIPFRPINNPRSPPTTAIRPNQNRPIQSEAARLPRRLPRPHCGGKSSPSTKSPPLLLHIRILDRYFLVLLQLMILVDDAGGAFPSINHSPWFGVTIADFVMPFFLFGVGVSVALVFKKASNKSAATMKVVTRTIKLFVLGLILQEDIHRIFFSSIVRNLAREQHCGEFTPGIFEEILCSMVFCGIRGSLQPSCNAVGLVDRVLLGEKHLYQRPVYRRTKVDIKQFRRSTILLQWMGMNALIVYALAAYQSDGNLIASRAPFETVGHTGICLAGDPVLVSYSRFPPHETHIRKIVAITHSWLEE